MKPKETKWWCNFAGTCTCNLHSFNALQQMLFQSTLR